MLEKFKQNTGKCQLCLERVLKSLQKKEKGQVAALEAIRLEIVNHELR